MGFWRYGSGSEEIRAIPRFHAWVSENKMEQDEPEWGCLLQEEPGFRRAVLRVPGRRVSTLEWVGKEKHGAEN